MSGGASSHLVKIPAVFIGLKDGLYINSTFLYTIDDNVTVIIDGKTQEINWLDRYVWPFLASVVFVFLLLAAFSVYKVRKGLCSSFCVRECLCSFFPSSLSSLYLFSS